MQLDYSGKAFTVVLKMVIWTLIADNNNYLFLYILYTTPKLIDVPWTLCVVHS